MNKFSSYFLVGAFICVIASYFYIYQLISSYNLQLRECKKEMYNSIALQEKYLLNQKKELFSDFRVLDDIKITGVDATQNRISDLVDNEVLVYRFSRFSCPPCVDNDMKILNQMADSIGVNNLLVLSDAKGVKELKIFSDLNQLKFPLYTYPVHLSLQADVDTVNDASYYFIINKDLETKFTYISRSSHSVESPYFNRVIEYFKHK